MKLRRLLAFCTAATLTAVSLSACGTNNAAQSDAVSDTEEEAAVVAVVNDEKITAEDLGYYIYVAAYTKYYEIEDANAELDFDGYDWSQDFGGVELSEAVKEAALENAIEDKVAAQHAYDIVAGDDPWTEEDDTDGDETVDEYFEEYGEEDFNLMARSMGISGVDEYKRVYNTALKTQAVASYIESDDIASYTPVDVDMNDYKDENYCTAKHILLLVDDEDEESYDDATASALIEELYQRLLNGEDFDTLMEEYNDDEGETSSGYTFGRGEMVSDLEDAAFALDIGEMSGIVHSDYGYHIIQRMMGFYDLVNYWVSLSDVSIDEDVLAEVSVKDVMDDVAEATAELEAQEED